jgi:hypothetical protein
VAHSERGDTVACGETNRVVCSSLVGRWSRRHSPARPSVTSSPPGCARSLPLLPRGGNRRRHQLRGLAAARAGRGRTTSHTRRFVVRHGSASMLRGLLDTEKENAHRPHLRRLLEGGVGTPDRRNPRSSVPSVPGLPPAPRRGRDSSPCSAPTTASTMARWRAQVGGPALPSPTKRHHLPAVTWRLGGRPWRGAVTPCCSLCRRPRRPPPSDPSGATVILLAAPK